MITWCTVPDVEHDTIDHAAVTGVLSTAAHAAVDHAAITGVLSATEHAAVDHAAITGVLSSAEHAATDHEGLTGIPVPVGPGRIQASGIDGWLLPGVIPVSAAALALTVSRTYYMPILVETETAVTAINANVTSQGAGGTEARVGIYEADADWQPGALVVEGMIAIDSTGEKTVAVTETLAPGRYLLAINANGSASFQMIRGNVAGLISNDITAPMVSAIYVPAVGLAALPDPGTVWTTLVTHATAPCLHPVRLIGAPS